LADEDVRTLEGFKEKLDQLRQKAVFRTTIRGAGIREIDLPTASFNLLELTECMEHGEQVRHYTIHFPGTDQTSICGCVVGFRRLLPLSHPISLGKLRIEIQAPDNAEFVLALWLSESSTQTGGDVITIDRDPHFRNLQKRIFKKNPNELIWKFPESFQTDCFVVIPHQVLHPEAPINWSLCSSQDGEEWQPLSPPGHFDNLRANPIPQTVHFNLTVMRYLRFRVNDTQNGENLFLSRADFGILEL